MYGRRRKIVRRVKRRAIAKPVNMISKTFRTPKGPWRKFNQIDPFPLNYNTKFVYVSDQTLTSAGLIRTTGNIYEWRLNSPYDPDYTSIAPIASNTTAYAYKDLLSSLGPYLKYKVNGVKIDIVWYDPEIDGMVAVSHIKANNDTYAIGAQDVQYLERSPMTLVNRMNDSGSQKKHLTQYFPMNQLVGWTKEQFRADNDTSTAPHNTYPVLTPRLQLCVANMTDNTLRFIRVRVKLTYYTTCYGRYAQTAQEAPI